MKKIIEWFKKLFLQKELKPIKEEDTYKFFFVEDLPENLHGDEIFIGGTKESNWVILLKCPCKCGDKIYLNTMKEEKPFWKIQFNEKQQITLTPSIWRTKNCKSHFFIREGKVKWAN